MSSKTTESGDPLAQWAKTLYCCSGGPQFESHPVPGQFTVFTIEKACKILIRHKHPN